MASRRLLPLIPVLIFVVLAVFFVRRLQLIERGNMPDVIPSVMINKPAPVFSLPALYDGLPNVTAEQLKGHVTLVNIFASWCLPCRVEHPNLELIKNAGITLIGINYKDKPEAARAWLAKMGNPYDLIAADKDGHVGIDFGAYGVPESYLIDKQGVIRFKQTGPMTPDVIRERIVPIAKELNK